MRLIYGDRDIQKWLWLISEDGADDAEEDSPAAETPETAESAVAADPPETAEPLKAQ